jgi:hypothetical protein
MRLMALKDYMNSILPLGQQSIVLSTLDEIAEIDVQLVTEPIYLIAIGI